ncbi:MAG: hypothetical protein ABIH66_03465 [bacterium]
MDIIRKYIEKTNKFKKEAHSILEKHESSPSRVISLDQTRGRLTSLSLKQNGLFKEALLCVEHELYKSAHIMAWAAFMDYLEVKLSSDGFKKLKKERPKWTIKTIDDLRDNIAEYQIIEAAHKLNLITRNEMKTLHGHLSKRNECAHPTDVEPQLNDTLGFISDLLSRIERLQKKKL